MDLHQLYINELDEKYKEVFRYFYKKDNKKLEEAIEELKNLLNKFAKMKVISSFEYDQYLAKIKYFQ